MGRNCCCINGFWLKGHKARPNHHNHNQNHLNQDSGKANQMVSNCSQTSLVQTLTKRRHTLTTGANGFTITRRFCARNNNQKLHNSSKNNYFAKHHCSEQQSEKQRTDITKEIFMYFVLFSVSILCFVNSLEGDFVHDDIVAITTNPDVLGKTPVHRLFLHDFWGKPMADPGMYPSISLWS